MYKRQLLRQHEEMVALVDRVQSKMKTEGEDSIRLELETTFIQQGYDLEHAEIGARSIMQIARAEANAR
mgnify:CR=1 FL=1